MKRISYSPLSVIILLLVSQLSSANGTADVAGSAEIRGKIIDSSSRELLVGANVLVEHTTIGAATDLEGEYRILTAPVGELHVVASMIGYKSEHKVVTVQAGEVLTVDFELEPTVLEMGTIVITGTASPRIYEDTPVRTEVIPRHLIEQKHAANLAEALSLQTGVRVENNCTNCNFSQVRILGQDGKYSQILIDGDPVVSSLAGVYGLEHFPEEMLDRIEIVKGGGSSLYGGGAVAGVVNMITRRPMMNQVRLKSLSQSIDGELDQHVSAVAEMANADGTSGAYVFGSVRKRNPYDSNDDGYSELGELANESVGFNWCIRPVQTGEATAHFHRIHEERRGGNKFDRPVHEAEIAESIEHWRWGGTVRWKHRPTASFDYRVYYSFALENRTSYYGGLAGETTSDTLEALTFYGKTENPLHVGGVQMNYRLCGQLFTVGWQYSLDKLVDKATANPVYYIDDVYTDLGVFFQDNLRFGNEEEIEFVLGARVDKHSEINTWIFSPRINGKFQIGSGFLLRGAFTTGFKAPQTYDEDLHLCGIEGDQRITRNDENLKEERSHSFSAGIEFHDYIDHTPVIFSVTGFYTNLKDVFTEEFVRKTGNIEEWQRINGEGASVRGIEFDAGIRPVSRIELRAGLTYEKCEYDQPLEDFDTKNFLRTPDLYGHLRLSLDMTSRINVFAAGNYTGEADVPHEIVTEGQQNPDLIVEKSGTFFEFDLGLSYRVPVLTGVSGKFSIGIKNVTNAYQDDLDEGPDRDPAYIYGPILPRTAYAGFETSF